MWLEMYCRTCGELIRVDSEDGETVKRCEHSAEHATSKPLAFPSVTKLADLFDVISREKTPALGRNAPRFSSWDDPRDMVPLGPYCGISGAKGRATVYVHPTARVIDHCRNRMIYGCRESLSFEIIVRRNADGTASDDALVCARNSQIIGGTWLAIIPASEVTPYLTAEED